MEFNSSATSRLGRHSKRGPIVPLNKSYRCSIQMYKNPPDGIVSLAEFDLMAIERLKILRAIERHNLSGPIRGSEEWVSKIYEEFNKSKNFIVSSEKVSENRAAEVGEARHRDHISHFILRLVYCRTEELRRWFISQEVDLLRVRFLHSSNTKEEVKAFCRENGMQFTPISDEEFNEERENLLNGTHRIGSGDQLEGRVFYKVPFTEATDLTRSRRVFLKLGYAYVPDTELISLISSVYRAQLSKELAHTNRALPQLEDEDRLTKLLQNFDRRYTGSDYSTKKDSGTKITPEMLDTLAVKSFPLCMRRLHETLTTTYHLKHGGRMQYGLFLKAAGLSLEDALYFWRSHMTKAMDTDKFDKQYSYNIRHNYGKEGKRTNYSPYSCIKIISSSVGPGDAHGCPFKLTDAPVLRQRLIGYGVNSSVAGDIVDLSSKGHYQIACQKYWESVHKTPLESGVNHPNQYVEESRKLATGEMKPAAPKPDIKTRRSVLPFSQNSNSSQLSSQTPNKGEETAKASQDFEFDDEFDEDFDMIDESIERHNAKNSNQENTLPLTDV